MKMLTESLDREWIYYGIHREFSGNIDLGWTCWGRLVQSKLPKYIYDVEVHLPNKCVNVYQEVLSDI